MKSDLLLAREAIAFCRQLALFSETTCGTTRTFLSAPFRACHNILRQRMEELGLEAHVDAIGNLRGFLAGNDSAAGRVLLGSHIDTVPDAGAFDGVLGVAIALALIQTLDQERLGCGVEVIAFSEEEGIRFGLPFLGSRALTGDLRMQDLRIKDAQNISIENAIRDFGLNPAELGLAMVADDSRAFIEFHIEQGPALDAAGESLGIVEVIAGQSRFELTFTGKANHAGTTPMALRRDALAGAAEWVLSVEQEARSTPDLVATVGYLTVQPGASNVIPGEVRTSLDVRSAVDRVRHAAIQSILLRARQISGTRGVDVKITQKLDQPAVPMNADLVSLVQAACSKVGLEPRLMVSGAGHDAMILAQRVPAVMMFLRSPGGISHHPDETVRVEDVEAAIGAGRQLVRDLDAKLDRTRTT